MALSMKKEKASLSGSKLNALVWKEGGLFVAKAIEVEVASQGKTQNEAMTNLDEALKLYFEDENYPTSKIKPLKDLELHRVSGNFNYA